MVSAPQGKSACILGLTTRSNQAKSRAGLPLVVWRQPRHGHLRCHALELQWRGNGAVQVYLPRLHDKLHLHRGWPIGAEVLERAAVQGELQGHGTELAHTFDFQPLLRMYGCGAHLGKGRSNLCVARIIKEDDVSVTEPAYGGRKCTFVQLGTGMRSSRRR
jgi:hypothetical protein